MNLEHRDLIDSEISTPETARVFLIVTRPIGRHISPQIKIMRQIAMQVISDAVHQNHISEQK